MSAGPYDDPDRAAVHRVIAERRDVRRGFLPDPVDDEVLTRVLQSAHLAPSVGFSQPWDFLVIRRLARRERVAALAAAQREAFAQSLPAVRARMFAPVKIEAILQTPLNIVVTCDPTRGGRHVIGRHTDARTSWFFSALAVQNLWLAARAEGLGVGWVSFFNERELAAELGLPAHIEVVAYLCVGHVDEFLPAPELALAGWARRRQLSFAVHEDVWGARHLPGGPTVSLLDETVAAISPADATAVAAAWERQNALTKPRGALGGLEEVAARLAGIAAQCPPPLPEPVAIAVFAADHGVHAQGVTPWPQEVTGQMVANFLAGGAVVNALARQVGAEVCVVDVGVAGPASADIPGLLRRRVRAGTADMTLGPAMTRAQALAAIEVGIEVARDLVTAGNRLLVAGDMGIANTTASAALVATFCQVDPELVTGRGTGIDDQTLAHKVTVVREALRRNNPDPRDPVGALASVGGLEHAAIVGFLLGAAASQVPVVLDGVITGAAALVAHALAPHAVDHWVAGHSSSEPGAAVALAHLGLRPLIDLDLRLGEGSGAVLAVPLVQAAARILAEVATFDSAGVSDKTT